MNRATEQMIEALESNRRVGWAKFYDLARMVAEGDMDAARATAAAALRQEVAAPDDGYERFGPHLRPGDRLSVPLGPRDPEVRASALSRMRAAVSSARGGSGK